MKLLLSRRSLLLGNRRGVILEVDFLLHSGDSLVSKSLVLKHCSDTVSGH